MCLRYSICIVLATPGNFSSPLVDSAFGTLRVMASNLIATEILAISSDPSILHLWQVLSGAGESDSFSAYYELTRRLSPICITSLWEGSSSLVSFHREIFQFNDMTLIMVSSGKANRYGGSE